MAIDLAQHVAVAVAAFLASLVEFAEALTIVLAVGAVRGFRPALLGAAAAVFALLLLVAALGPLLAGVPITWLQMAVGILLLLFGMRWLRKAVLRAAGVIARRDEMSVYAVQSESLERNGPEADPADPVAIVTSFKAVLLEGLEVVFVVIAVGAAGNMLVPAAAGAVTALLLVGLLGLAVHHPLTRVPENALKLVAGVLLSSFGVFWIGEGAGLHWPAANLAVFALAGGFLGAAVLSILLARHLGARPARDGS